MKRCPVCKSLDSLQNLLALEHFSILQEQLIDLRFGLFFFSILPRSFMRADVFFPKQPARIHIHSTLCNFRIASCAQTALVKHLRLLPAAARPLGYSPSLTTLHTASRNFTPSAQQQSTLSSLCHNHQAQAGHPSLVQQRLQRRSFTACAYAFRMAKRDDVNSVPVSASPTAPSTSSSSKYNKGSSLMSPKVRAGAVMDPSSPVQAFVPTLGSPSSRGFALTRVPSVHSPGGGHRSVGSHTLSDNASAKGKKQQSMTLFSINKGLSDDTTLSF